MFNNLLTVLRLSKSIAEHLRKQGLKIGKHCEIYNGWNFGSEPYLITLGDYVRVASGVRFITHDGGVPMFFVNSLGS